MLTIKLGVLVFQEGNRWQCACLLKRCETIVRGILVITCADGSLTNCSTQMPSEMHPTEAFQEITVKAVNESLSLVVECAARTVVALLAACAYVDAMVSPIYGSVCRRKIVGRKTSASPSSSWSITRSTRWRLPRCS